MPLYKQVFCQIVDSDNFEEIAARVRRHLGAWDSGNYNYTWLYAVGISEATRTFYFDHSPTLYNMPRNHLARFRTMLETYCAP